MFLKAVKNAFTRDLKWCDYVVVHVEGGLLFNNQYVKRLLFSALMFGIEFIKI